MFGTCVPYRAKKPFKVIAKLLTVKSSQVLTRLWVHQSSVITEYMRCVTGNCICSKE